MASKTPPDSAFVSPRGDNAEAVSRLLTGAVERVVRQLSRAAERPPLPAGRAPRIAALPAEPLADAALLDELEGLLQASMNPANPGWIGHMDPLPATASLVGALGAAAANNNLLSLEMSPALSHLEQDLMAAFARRFGLPAGSGGVMASGGSLANLLALTVARNRAFPVAEEGLAGLGRRPVILASEAAHTSLQKAAMILGLGSAAVIPVATDADGRMAPAALSAALAEAKAGGAAPFAVVATAGTTVTGSLDPLTEIGAIARAEGLWFHVDAAYGGALILSARAKARLAGIEQADSIVFNPQKWLYVAKTCACCLFRDRGLLERHFRVAAPYMAEAGGFTNLGELGPQGSRPAEVLKLWLTLRHLGTRRLAALIDDSLALCSRLHAELAGRPGLELAAQPDSNILCFRPLANESDSGASELQKRLLAAGLFLSLPLYRGRRWLRLVPLNPFTGAPEIERLFAVIDAFLAEGQGP